MPGQPRGLHLAVEVGVQQVVEEAVQLLAVPRPGHVRLAEAEVALGQCALEGGGIVQLHVPGPAAVDPDVGAAEQAGDQLLGSGVELGRAEAHPAMVTPRIGGRRA